MDYSQKIIKDFYSNLNVEIGNLFSSIKGTQILVSEERMLEILGLLPPDEPRFSKIHSSLATVQGFLKAQAYMTVMGCDEPADNCLVKINKLNLERRLLPNVVTHCLLNKSENFAYANESE